MTTSERISWRSPELWFGIFAGIAIPTLLARFTALLLSNFPGEPGSIAPRLLLTLGVALPVALSIVGFALRQRHAWAVGLLAGSLLLLLPTGAGEPLLFGDGPIPFGAQLGLWAGYALPGLTFLAVAVTVIQRVRFADYVALGLSVAVAVYSLDLALVA